MTLAEDTKKALKELGLSPKKKFGQNFMIDAASLEVIAESLSLEKG